MKSLIAIVAASLLCLTASCGEEKKEKEEEEANGVIRSFRPPCMRELSGECGASCAEDSECPDALHCGDDGTCTAVCTDEGEQCGGSPGECERGRCDGELQEFVDVIVDNTGGGDIILEQGPITSTPGEFEACAGVSASAEVRPIHLMIMFDRTSSMTRDNKWDNASSALLSFLKDPGTGGLGVAFRFFADDEPAAGCNIYEDGCNMEACGQVLVEMGLLTAEPGDPHEARLVGIIENTVPNPQGPGTPIFPALGGAINYARAYQDANPAFSVAVVFVTDGEPTGCERGEDEISQLAADGLQDGIRTYSIGLEGSAEGLMNRIAERGGTGEAIFIGGAAVAEEQLLNALNVIRGQALTCSFATPEPNDVGTVVDPEKVNITWSPSAGGQVTFPRAQGQDQCGDQTGWYFLPGGTDQMALCPQACDLVNGDPTGQLDVVLGCAPVLIEGRPAQ